MLQIQLFSSAEVYVNGARISLSGGTRVEQLLFRLFISEGKPLLRDQLAESLWPNSSNAQARTNLRRELHACRKLHTVIKEHLTSSRSTVIWNIPEKSNFDVRSFNHHRISFNKATEDDERLKYGLEALNAYTGPLFPELTDTWSYNVRDEHSRYWLSIAEVVATSLELNNQLSQAIQLLDQLVTAEPLNERYHGMLIKQQLKFGNSAKALKCYENIESILQIELGILPSDDLQGLKDQILSSTELNKAFENSNSSLQPQPAYFYRKDKSEFIEAGFFGRENELKLLERLEKEKINQSCIVVVSGEPGIGKTRLIQEYLNSKDPSDRIRLTACGASTDTNLPYKTLATLLSSDKLLAQFNNLPLAMQAQLTSAFPDLYFKHQQSKNVQHNSYHFSRRLLFSAVSALFELVQKPIVCFFDDIHWCDNLIFTHLSMTNFQRRQPLIARLIPRK